MSPDYDSLRKQELNKVDKKKWDKRLVVHLAPGTRQYLQICQTQASSTSRKMRQYWPFYKK